MGIKVQYYLIALLITIVGTQAQNDIDSNENEDSDESEIGKIVDEDNEKWGTPGEISDEEANEDEIERSIRQAKFKDYEIAGLNCHNKYRALHKDPKMSLDPKLNKIAQNYAVKLAKSGKMIHSISKNYGENLSMSTAKISKVKHVEEACNRWYNENKLYNYNHPVFDKKTGHFTAMIWKATTHLGIGIATGPKGTFIVANYRVKPNMKGQFKSNVLKG